MLQFTKINPDPKFQPYIDGQTCRWLLPTDFNENTGLASLGKLQSLLKNDAIQCCKIDTGMITWADPQPLLCLGLILAESRLEKSQINMDIGKIEDCNRDHLIFLKFFARQGFLLEFSLHAQFSCDGVIIADIDKLRFDLANQQLPTYFFNADCIHARIIRVDQYNDDTDSLPKKVGKLFQDAKDRSAQNAFGSNPFNRDILFQKIRKLLYELLLNVAEHSHPDGGAIYAGVYARIRAAKPPIHRDAKKWTTLFEKKTIAIFGQRTFRPNHYAEWLELFICDVGVGLTHDIQNWQEPKDDPHAVKILRQAKKKKHPFQSIVAQFFHAPLSRHPRHAEERTAVTGLQHLGHLLSIDGDHCRIYTEKGSWAGDHFPWAKCEFSIRNIQNLKSKDNKIFSNFTPASGTFYTFSIQPEHRNLSNDPPWEFLDQDGQQEILQALRKRTFFDGDQKRVVWFDRHGKDSCSIPQPSELPDHDLDVIVLRPPRILNKQDIAKWLDLVAGDSQSPAEKSIKLMILADLTPFQTLIFHELLKHVVIHRDTKQAWYLVSEQWAVTCLMTVPGEKNFKPSKQKAREFLASAGRDISFTIADLAILLRQMDSEIFWEEEKDSGRAPFFNYPVVWDSAHGKQSIRLQRYLDFPLALINSNRYRACLRSLLRCLALFPDHTPVGADDLVASLVREASLALYHQATDAPQILIGSISVTGKTVKNLLPAETTKSLQILNHSEAEGVQGSGTLSALLWISQLPNAESFQKKTTGKPWRRIPYTPYIAPLGEKSISVLRYRKNDDGSLNFDNPYYGRTPENTYNDFQRLGILKAGHWKYGSRHDLLTINMRLAFHFSFQEKGPLYFWLLDQFRELFSKTNNTLFLLYPSHPVTDMLFDRIRRDSSFQEILPKGGMIPIKFLGKRTVSPLLASHLVKYRIARMLEENKWGNKKWTAVVFDDGTISGKHFRETTQFLQAQGASKVYLIAILDRTGLPVQEKVYDAFFKKHKRFWRWDVPGLGNKRNCALCQALAIVQTYSQELASEHQKHRLDEWINIWKVRNVDLEWYQAGLQPTVLDPPIKITFGIDPERSTAEHPREKRLLFSSSTAATSLLMELTRLTTRTDVVIKKGEQVLHKYPDAAIEMIASQLFLYMDELSPKEKLERFKKLIEWPWERKRESNATSLAGLCLTLVEDNLAEALWKHCNGLLSSKLMGNLDIILSVSILCSRHEFLTRKPYKPSGSIKDYEVKNYLLLNRKVKLSQDIKSLLTLLISNPGNPYQGKIHQTEIKKRIDTLCNTDFEKYSNLGVLICNITEDISLIHGIISRLQQEYTLELPDNCLQLLEELAQQINEAKDKPDAELKQLGQRLSKLLYGPGETSLVKKVLDQMFLYAKDADAFNDEFVVPNILTLQTAWQGIINDKIEHNISNGYADSEWNEMEYWLKKKDGEFELLEGKAQWNEEEPIITSSENNIQKGIWCYCDRHFKRAFQDMLANVLHATDTITDPFIEDNDSLTRAHLWWCAEIKDNHLVFKTANASKNKEISLKQRVSLACIERIGGKVRVRVDPKETNYERSPFIAYTELHLPLFKFFIGEK